MDHSHHNMVSSSAASATMSMATSTIPIASATVTSNMDMSGTDHSGHSMDMGMNMGVFHWGLYDTGLWLPSWVPSTNSALVGACFGLFFISFFSRTLPALEAYFVAWKRLRDNKVVAGRQRLALVTKQDIEQPSGKAAEGDDHSLNSYHHHEAAYPNPYRLPSVPAFSWTTDTVRSFITAVNAFVGYLLMMAVMTGNGAYFLVVILGVLFGEIAFGRFRSLNGFADDHAH